MRTLAAIVFLIFLVPVYSQEYNSKELDSLYNVFVEIHRNAESTVNYVNADNIKCATGIVNQIVRNVESYEGDRKQLLRSLLQRPTKQKSIVSPQGRFRIHYDVTGTEAPKYDLSLTPDENAMLVGIAADSAYNFEVNYLGYPPPPSDNNEGGDNKLDIYITTALGSYGFTELETYLGNQKYTSYIEIHCNFQGSDFATHGLDAVRVSVAHELHHTIQFGNYTGEFDMDSFFYEMTSTSMEEFVYDDVNDYYAYMPHYFNNPNRIFNSFRPFTVDGYDIAIWNIFLQDKYGYEIIKKQWEMLPDHRALSVIQSTLIDVGTTFGEALHEFGIWTFFTKHRAIPGKYFEEAANYPLIRSLITSYIPNRTVSITNIKAASNNFLAIVNSSVIPSDTLVVIITNSDFYSANDSSYKNFSFEYTLGSNSNGGSVLLANNYFAKFTVDDPNFWSVSEILNNEIVRQNGTIIPPIEATGKPFAYPNPFYYNKIYNNDCNCIKIVVDSEGELEADFNVYTPAMELVYSAKIPFDVTGKVLDWNINKVPAKKLASGVYIYVTKIGDETTAGKLVIFNE
jgi:hypothetical protein